MSTWVDATARTLDRWIAGVIPGSSPSSNDTYTVPPIVIDLTESKSLVTASPSVTWSEDKGVRFRSRFSAHLSLPRSEDRVQFVINNIQEDEDVLDNVSDPFSRDRRVEGEEDKVAGLRVLLFDDMNFDLSFSGGIRFTPEPRTKFRLKGRLHYEYERIRFDITETGFWEDGDGFGCKTEFITRYRVNDRLTLRNTFATVIEEVTDGPQLGETLSFQYALQPRRTIGMKIATEWRTQPTAAVNAHSLRIPFRQGILRDWLYLRIEPGADFRDEDDFDFSPQITVGLDMQFGDVATRHKQ